MAAQKSTEKGHPSGAPRRNRRSGGAAGRRQERRRSSAAAAKKGGGAAAAERGRSFQNKFSRLRSKPLGAAGVPARGRTTRDKSLPPPRAGRLYPAGHDGCQVTSAGWAALFGGIRRGAGSAKSCPQTASRRSGVRCTFFVLKGPQPPPAPAARRYLFSSAPCHRPGGFARRDTAGSAKPCPPTASRRSGTQCTLFTPAVLTATVPVRCTPISLPPRTEGRAALSGRAQRER